MKTRRCLVLISLALLFLAGAAQAQSQVSFGVRAGLVASKWSVDHEAVNPGTRTALAGGVAMLVQAPGPLSVQVEALYAPKGSQETLQATDENGDPAGEVTATWKVDYLEIPILARLAFDSSPIYVLGGAVLDIKLSSQLTATDGYEEDLDWVEDTDLGLVAGLGAVLPASLGSVVIEARYTWGTTNVNSGAGSEIKNKAFMALAGVNF